MAALLDLIYPPRCVGCHRPGVMLCPRCSADVVRIDTVHACPRCGAPDGHARCPECAERDFAFHGARCAALLAPPISTAIVTLKDAGERRCATLIAQLLAETGADWLASDEVLVPVPASPAAVRRRGFDHARDITRALGRETGLLVLDVLRSSRASDQRELSRSERFHNRAGTFSVLRPAEVPERIVLVDDVLTTGATLDAAATTLLAEGALRVRALAAARAVRDSRR